MRAPGAAVLCYHGITTPAAPSASVANIPAEEVVSAIGSFRSDREIVPLGELLDRLKAGKSVAGLGAITFDDAYASLGQSLAGWLTAEQIPFSIFVTSDASRTGARFWWDRIDDLFPRVTPARWREFEDEIGLPESYRRGQPTDYGPLRPLRQFALARFQGRWPANLEDSLAALEAEVGFWTAQHAMTYEEINAIGRAGAVEIGVHTLSHPVLPLLQDDEITREVRQCWFALRERFSTVIPVLAIPFGLFDPRSLRLAAEAGMEHCLSLANRLLRAGPGTPAVPRLSMTCGVPLWKRRLQWLGVTEAVRRLVRLGREAEVYPALPSSTN